MDTDACPVSRITSTAAGSISSPSSGASGAESAFEAPLFFPLSAAFLSISAITSSE